MTKESLDNQIDKKTTSTSTSPSLKSAKNMAGYAEDKEIDPKLLKVGEMVKAAQEEDMADTYTCSDDECIDNQKKRKEMLEKNRLITGK